MTCAGNPCSVPVCTCGGSSAASCGPPLYCTVMSDTAGIGYRAFAPVYGWLTGKPVNAVDKWTNNILQQQETQTLVQAGMHPADAAAQAASDICKSKTVVKPACTSPWSLTTWIFVIAAAAIVLIVGTNAFVSKEL
jgi:hypothetical protein